MQNPSALARDLIEICNSAAATQELFLYERGLTREEARRFNALDRVKLQKDYAAWLHARSLNLLSLDV